MSPLPKDWQNQNTSREECKRTYKSGVSVIYSSSDKWSIHSHLQLWKTGGLFF